jgi:hypothetical protein
LGYPTRTAGAVVPHVVVFSVDYGGSSLSVLRSTRRRLVIETSHDALRDMAKHMMMTTAEIRVAEDSLSVDALKKGRGY